VCDERAVEPGFGRDLPQSLPSLKVFAFEEFPCQDLRRLLPKDPGGRRGAAAPLPGRPWNGFECEPDVIRGGPQLPGGLADWQLLEDDQLV